MQQRFACHEDFRIFIGNLTISQTTERSVANLHAGLTTWSIFTLFPLLNVLG